MCSIKRQLRDTTDRILPNIVDKPTYLALLAKLLVVIISSKLQHAIAIFFVKFGFITIAIHP